MSKRSRLGIILGLLWLSACQTPPTRIRETTAPIEDPGSYAARVLSDRPALLDVRSDIDFGMSRVPGSVNVRWEDLNTTNPRQKGVLDPDREALARRLALWGIDKTTTVLILGHGPEGRGEEGRVAWALNVLGLSKIETASIRLFNVQNPRDGENRPANKAFWTPVPVNTLELRTTEFEALVLKGNPAETSSSSRRIVVDLSHPNERQVRRLEDWKPVWPIVRMSWRDFYDEQGRGSCTRAAAKLALLKVTKEHEIILVDGDGVGAAAAGFVLHSCRFGKPRVLSSGLRGLKVRP